MTTQKSVHSDVTQRAMQDFVEGIQDPLQAIEDVRLEDAANCTIGAGYGQRRSSNVAMASSPFTQTQRQQLRILVRGEFCQMLGECNLGAGLPDAIRVGKQRLSERLKHPAENVQQQLIAALETAMTTHEAHNGIPQSARSQVRRVLRSVLSEQDWEAIAAAATTAILLNFRLVIADADAA